MRALRLRCSGWPSPKQSGLYLRPPPITEVLTTNLLPVTEMPPAIYVATSAVGDYRAGGEVLASRNGRRPQWILRDGLVVSFGSLREAPLSALCDGDVEEHDTSEWADSEDAEVRHRFIDLLSRTVQGSYPDLRWHNERRHVHFRASTELTPRKAGKGPRSRGRAPRRRPGAARFRLGPDRPGRLVPPRRDRVD